MIILSAEDISLCHYSRVCLLPAELNLSKIPSQYLQQVCNSAWGQMCQSSIPKVLLFNSDMLFFTGVVYQQEVCVCNLMEQEDPHGFSYTCAVSAEGTVFNILY